MSEKQTKLPYVMIVDTDMFPHLPSFFVVVSCLNAHTYFSKQLVNITKMIVINQWHIMTNGI